MKSLIRKLETHKSNGIWHFTDRSNYESIKEHGGILSLRELKRRGIAIPRPGGNEWSHDADRFKKIDNYVHLAFIKNHPMLFCAKGDGRIDSAIWLKIDLSVLLVDGVMFCPEVANKTGTQIIGPIDAMNQIDFPALFNYMDYSDPQIKARRSAAKKSEILIPDIVPYENITEVING